MKYELTQKRIDKFWSYCKVVDSGCWEWTRGCSNGYGSFHVGSTGRQQRSHRISFWLSRGYQPKLHVLHSCDNRKCINPDHLSEGTNQENLQQAAERNKLFNSRKTHCSKGHPLSGENIRLGRGTSRVCRACELIKSRLNRVKDLLDSFENENFKYGPSPIICKRGHLLDGKNLRISSGGRVCRKCDNLRYKAKQHETNNSNLTTVN